MARHRDPRANRLGQSSSFATVQVSRNLALRTVPIDRQQRDVDLETLHLLDNRIMPERIAAVVDRAVAGLDDVAEIFAAALRVAIDLGMCSDDAGDQEAGD